MFQHSPKISETPLLSAALLIFNLNTCGGIFLNVYKFIVLAIIVDM